MDQGSDVLTSYFLSLTSEAGLKLPAGPQSTIEKGLSDFVEGKVVRYESVPSVDLPLRKLAAIDALARVGKANNGMLSSITIDPNLWPDSAVIDWWSILLRMKSAPQRQRRLTAAEQIMRARINWQGTGAHLSGGDLWWLMIGPQTNTVRLVLLLLDHGLWRDDLPKVMTGAIAMQSRGAWATTPSNAWGTLAVNKFARTFEATPVRGTTTASLESASQKVDWAREPKGGTLDFAWPPAPAGLKVAHAGTGNPWVQVRTSAAIPLKSPSPAAIRSSRRSRRSIVRIPEDGARAISFGVHLKIEAQTDMTWVVVSDPIPAGASHLGTGLARDSQIATSTENLNNNNFLWPDFVERPFDAYRAYYDYVPKGTFELEYTIRLNQSGTFQCHPLAWRRCMNRRCSASRPIRHSRFNRKTWKTRWPQRRKPLGQRLFTVPSPYPGRARERLRPPIHGTRFALGHSHFAQQLTVKHARSEPHETQTHNPSGRDCVRHPDHRLARNTATANTSLRPGARAMAPV